MDSHRSKHHIRMRSFCCNLAAAFLLIGLLFLTCAIVLIILASTDPNVGKVFQELFEKATFESSQMYPSVGASNRLPMFVASGVGAIGVALVIISILFVCVSCVSASECFNNRGCEFRARKGQQPMKDSSDQGVCEPDSKVPIKPEQEEPLIARSPHFNRHIPVAIDEIENGSFEEGNRKSIIFPPGGVDFNQLGLPMHHSHNEGASSPANSSSPIPGTTANGVWIPPNGFSYLKNPSDLKNFYLESRASGRFNRIAQDHDQSPPPQPPTQQGQSQILVWTNLP